MPIYEFKCSECKEVKEIKASYGDNFYFKAMNCTCGGKAKRVYTSPSIAFKGKGFYSNDHKTRNK